jgi:hypothetical protein
LSGTGIAREINQPVEATTTESRCSIKQPRKEGVAQYDWYGLNPAVPGYTKTPTREGIFHKETIVHEA